MSGAGPVAPKLAPTDEKSVARKPILICPGPRLLDEVGLLGLVVGPDATGFADDTFVGDTPLLVRVATDVLDGNVDPVGCWGDGAPSSPPDPPAICDGCAVVPHAPASRQASAAAATRRTGELPRVTVRPVLMRP
jgi:hypothetical protein